MQIYSDSISGLVIMANGGGTVVKDSSHHPKVKGLNPAPASGTRGEKDVKNS